MLPSVDHSNMLGESLLWIASSLTGSLAACVGVLAIAGIGIGMLFGHFSVRASARTVLGCFIIFGAGSIASTMTQWVTAATPSMALVTPQASAPLDMAGIPQAEPIQDPNPTASLRRGILPNQSVAKSQIGNFRP